MGGYGSTRWRYHQKKDTVDDSWTLSIFEMNREGLLKPNTWRSGRWVWRNKFSDEVLAFVGYELNLAEKPCTLRLRYTVTRWSGEKRKLDYPIRLQSSPCNFGGIRWWFICPLVKNDLACRRQVGKLYQPPGGLYFGCRHCYDLTYRSSQESDKRVQALRKLGPYVILEMMKHDEVDVLTGLKALPDHIWRR